MIGQAAWSNMAMYSAGIIAYRAAAAAVAGVGFGVAVSRVIGRRAAAIASLVATLVAWACSCAVIAFAALRCFSVGTPVWAVTHPLLSATGTDRAVTGVVLMAVASVIVGVLSTVLMAKLADMIGRALGLRTRTRRTLVAFNASQGVAAAAAAVVAGLVSPTGSDAIIVAVAVCSAKAAAVLNDRWARIVAAPPMTRNTSPTSATTEDE